MECGTHAVVDLEVEPCNGSERAAGLRLLRSVGKGMLLTWLELFTVLIWLREKAKQELIS